MVKMARQWRQKTRVIHDETWDPRETITLRTYFGDHDRQRILSASTEYRRGERDEMTIVATLDKLHAVKREIAVVSWTLLDEDGQPLPFDRDTLLNLPPEVAAFIDAEINKDFDNLGEPVASKEEAEAQERAEKDDRATFQRHPVRDANGAAPDVGADDAARAGDRPARRATPA